MQFVQVPAAPVENEPAWQLTQKPAFDAPDCVEYVPDGQPLQTTEALAPMAVENVPATQLTHAPAPLLDHVPAAQDVQAAMLDAPGSDENDPLEQLVHTLGVCAPMAVPYVPALHWVHVDAAVIVEYVPAVQDRQLAAPAREY